MIELSLDELLEWFRDNVSNVLQMIDDDPLLSKREVDGLIIANASKELHSPTEKHQQLAKGIVYTKDYRLVAMPLAKIWNAHEMEQDQAEIVNSYWNHDVFTPQFTILEKLDGTMISRFVYNDKVYFATRGVLMGDELDGDYVQQAVSIAREKYPKLLDPTYGNGRTLVFELIFPQGRIITNYGDKRDLILTSSFHHASYSYEGYQYLIDFAEYMGLNLVERYVADGNGWKEQIDNLLENIKGTDAEGFMLAVELHGRVLYRMKFKGADYIKLLRLMNYCTYKHVVEMILADDRLLSDYKFRDMLMAQSGDDLPEYVMTEYMSLHRKYVKFHEATFKVCYKVYQYCNEVLQGKDIPLSKEDKKNFALMVKDMPFKSLAFRFADGKSLYDVSREVSLKARGDLDYLDIYTKEGNKMNA